MTYRLNPRDLTWDEADPARHPFDHASADREIRALGPALRVPHRPQGRAGDRAVIAWSHGPGKSWADAMSHALVERYGRWAAGWRWALDEGDFDGGPVGAWCCPRDSITTPEETLDQVVAALCEWREWLEGLAGWFAAYPLDPAAVEDQRILWDRTARSVILQVVDRTGCGSGWYGHCRQVLTWFLSSRGVAEESARELVEQAVGGRFHSWCGPEPEVVEEIAEQLAGALRPEHGARAAGPEPDRLRDWLAVRAAVPWSQAPDSGSDGPVTPARDGAAEDIRAFDGALDPARAEGLLAALELVRADAARGAVLDFALLGGWQRHVLGTAQPPPFRTRPAFAKGGRERYGIGPDTRADLDACLAKSGAGDASPAASEAGDGAERAAEGGRPLPLTARAARAYLDVCFFHPFEDGNGRAAFLALVFVLAREGITLDEVGLLRRIAFYAHVPGEGLTLARYIDLHLTETRRRAAPVA
ncbi:Fic family protein [Streptomyces sp. NPDC047097]|uniref:Fic family protein n=1 Tax=Streptomyces sp. NPDC047097 TaxID=3155260 RepID=UPI0033E54A12